MIVDHFSDKWKSAGFMSQAQGSFILESSIKSDIAELRKEVMELKELLKRAIKYDEKMNQPDCEMAEKIALIKKVSELVGVDLSEVIKKDGTKELNNPS